MKPLPRTYDALFEAHLSVPIEYARALAWSESGMNPRNKTGSYWGLFQVGSRTSRTQPGAPGAQFSRDDLLSPEPNVKVGLGVRAHPRRAHRRRPRRELGQS
jgi:hypothetical protein